MNKKSIMCIVVAVAVVCGGIYVSLIDRIPTGKVGVQYSANGGVKDNVLSEGWHFVPPWIKMKEFSIGNEQLILSKDEREGSKDDDSFNVATSDDASIPISFQMSYRYDPDTVVDVYKRFKGMDGEDIIELRVKPRPTLMRSTHVCASSCPSDVSAGFIFLISASLFIFPFVIFSTLRLHILLNLF